MKKFKNIIGWICVSVLLLCSSAGCGTSAENTESAGTDSTEDAADVAEMSAEELFSDVGASSGNSQEETSVGEATDGESDTYAGITSAFQTAEGASGSDDGEAAGKKDTASQSSIGEYTQYDGYAYFLDDGQIKYQLEAGEDMKLHCWFVSDSVEYYERVYTLNCDTAETRGIMLEFFDISDDKGQDISAWFQQFEFSFGENAVFLNITRDEKTLAGGSGDNLLTGAYELKKAKKQWTMEGLSSKEAFGSSKTAASDGAKSISSDGKRAYTESEIGKLAQDYYEKHYNFRPPIADVEKLSDGRFQIHLYEIVDNGDGTYHTATSAWYTVDSYGVGENDVLGDKVDLTQ